MSSRSRVEFDEREYYREVPSRERQPSRPAPVREYDDVDIRIRERERDRVPAFLREERRPDAGQLVLRHREVETVDRLRRRSPSPQVRVRETRIDRARSVSPSPPKRVEEDIHIRTVERVREQSRPPVDRIRTRFVEQKRSPSPEPIIRTRIVERERQRSPSPAIRERIRIVEREKERPRSPTPPPPPQVIKGSVIEREVITHYRDIDHGMVSARPPTPPPALRRKERDTEIDIFTSRNHTDIDVHKHSSRSRARSHSRERPSPQHAWDDDVLVRSDRNHLHVDIEKHRSTSHGRRAHSAAPPVIEYDDEARYITNKIDSRGRMGEAWNGITKDWTIVDVPPGTERVRMDGAGGASAEVTWQKYSGVRRAKFIPDRDEKSTVSTSTTIVEREPPRERERDTRLSVQIYDSKDRGSEVDYKKITDRRTSTHRSAPPSPAPRRNEMWTEITKDLVTREAIEELNYEYEETEWFFYVMQYLRYDDVLQLVKLSDAIREAREDDPVREMPVERKYNDIYDFSNPKYAHKHWPSDHRSMDRYDDERERIVEHEVVYDSRSGGGRGYRH
ncbi:hypothetical protein B0T17DRAFT_397979 [Bombardia bombarda]|uniref:DUF8035 domain-containing protein n=1 Tax=Bombardia bombarda TaxID=252184 RepID=A0AA39TIS5_9PEZI|nr:hypothetical protein B0T17DRAFT_397979 [Bombardia bombarda]